MGDPASSSRRARISRHCVRTSSGLQGAGGEGEEAEGQPMSAVIDEIGNERFMVDMKHVFA